MAAELSHQSLTPVLPAPSREKQGQPGLFASHSLNGAEKTISCINHWGGGTGKGALATAQRLRALPWEHGFSEGALLGAGGTVGNWATPLPPLKHQKPRRKRVPARGSPGAGRLEALLRARGVAAAACGGRRVPEQHRGGGADVTQPACETPVFPLAWTSPRPRTPLPAGAGLLARGTAARGERQSQGAKAALGSLLCNGSQPWSPVPQLCLAPFLGSQPVGDGAGSPPASLHPCRAIRQPWVIPSIP